MKNLFREFYLNDEYQQSIWDTCFFVIDTNTLLDFYRISRDTASSLFDVLERMKLEGRLWLPHQVGIEFHRNRLEVINKCKDQYSSILQESDRLYNSLSQSIESHPFLSGRELLVDLQRDIDTLKSKVIEFQNCHPNWYHNDDIQERLKTIFDGITGSPYSEEELAKLYIDGNERYSKRIPPGFEDEKKPEDQRYGDLIIWNQIIDEVKRRKKSVIFVTGDNKKDWWLINKGEKLMILPELRKEIYNKTEYDALLCNSSKLTNKLSNDSLDTSFKSTIKELELLNSLQDRLSHNEEPFPERHYKFKSREKLNDEFLQLQFDESILSRDNDCPLKIGEKQAIFYEKFNLICKKIDKVLNLYKISNKKIYYSTNKIYELLNDEGLFYDNSTDKTLYANLNMLYNELSFLNMKNLDLFESSKELVRLSFELSRFIEYVKLEILNYKLSHEYVY